MPFPRPKPHIYPMTANPQPVKFCVRVNQGGYSYPELQRIWQDADRLGYDAASLYDLLTVPALECWTTLSALAAQTQNLRLIPMVLANLYRHPSLVAKMAATLDVITNGRVVLGIGAGGGRGDHLAAGFPFPSTAARVEMLEEAAQVIKLLWTQPDAHFQGRHYSLTGASCDPPPAQQPRPPLLIGGHGERYLLRAVAKHADICNIGSDMTLDEHRQKLQVLERHCLDAGRDISEIEVTHNASVLIAQDESHFQSLVNQQAARANLTPQQYRASIANAVAGTPQQCVARIQEYVDAGIRFFFLVFPHPAPTESLELFARQVMPHFQDLPRSPFPIEGEG